MKEPIQMLVGSDEEAFLLSRYCLPLGLKANSGHTVFDGAKRGTLSLIRLAERDVFVTCFHVHDALCSMRADDTSAEMVAYLVPPGVNGPGEGAELSGFTLIDGDARTLDVAIFAGLEKNVALPYVSFIDYSFYLSDPVVGEPVVIVGYPAANVSVTLENAAFNFTRILFPASSISDRLIVLANEHGTRRFIDYAYPPKLELLLGGLSGSPAFIIREGQYRFVGIVTDASEDQTILITRLGCINPDGTLNRAAMPW